MQIAQRCLHYVYLMRLHKPIGFLLVLWPTWWALWLAAQGSPQPKSVVIFTLGAFLMRSAGCVINDIADRDFDGKVQRTVLRPLASAKIQVVEALFLASFLSSCAFLLVLCFQSLQLIVLAMVGAMIAVIYPLLKRVTHWPQLGLGVAFSWGVPMAFAAETGQIEPKAWLLFATALLWPLIYDTYYALMDREDDLKIGVKSTAILWAQQVHFVIALLQVMFVFMLFTIGLIFHLNKIYYLMLLGVVSLFIYQQAIARKSEPQHYLAAFLNNNLVGMLIFLGIYLSYLE